MSWSRIGVISLGMWMQMSGPAGAQTDPPLVWGQLELEPSFEGGEDPDPDPDDPDADPDPKEPIEVIEVGAPEDASAPDGAVARLDVRVNVAVHDGGAGDDDLEEEQPEPRPKHFLVEGSAGVALTPGFGGTSHLLIGAGGRRPGGYLRFYALAGLSHASVNDSYPSGGLRYESSRHHLDVIAGLRIYLPLFGPLRLFTDLLGGGSHVWSSLSGGTFGPYAAQGWRPMFIWGLGLQVRVTQELSVGGRVALRSTSDPLEDLHEHVGASQATGLITDLAGTVSWHF